MYSLFENKSTLEVFLLTKTNLHFYLNFHNIYQFSRAKIIRFKEISFLSEAKAHCICIVFLTAGGGCIDCAEFAMSSLVTLHRMGSHFVPAKQ